MHYFSPKQVPVTHFLAKQYAVSDTYFAAAPLQTWPNRMFAHCATSGGMLNNTQFLPVLFKEALLGIKSIFDQLDAVDASKTRIPATTPRWKVYYQDFPLSILVKHVRDNWKIGNKDSKVAHSRSARASVDDDRYVLLRRPGERRAARVLLHRAPLRAAPAHPQEEHHSPERQPPAVQRGFGRGACFSKYGLR